MRKDEKGKANPFFRNIDQAGRFLLPAFIRHELGLFEDDTIESSWTVTIVNGYKVVDLRLRRVPSNNYCSQCGHKFTEQELEDRLRTKCNNCLVD